MKIRLVRRVALLLIALYAFGQAGIAAAAGCQMDRSAMAQAMAMPAGDTCDECPVPVPVSGVDSITALCVAHCTADLQLPSAQPDPVAVPAIHSVSAAIPTSIASPPTVIALPPGALPRRILLHSFQV